MARPGQRVGGRARVLPDRGPEHERDPARARRRVGGGQRDPAAQPADHGAVAARPGQARRPGLRGPVHGQARRSAARRPRRPAPPAPWRSGRAAGTARAGRARRARDQGDRPRIARQPAGPYALRPVTGSPGHRAGLAGHDDRLAPRRRGARRATCEAAGATVRIVPVPHRRAAALRRTMATHRPRRGAGRAPRGPRRGGRARSIYSTITAALLQPRARAVRGALRRPRRRQPARRSGGAWQRRRERAVLAAGRPAAALERRGGGRRGPPGGVAGAPAARRRRRRRRPRTRPTPWPTPANPDKRGLDAAVRGVGAAARRAAPGWASAAWTARRAGAGWRKLGVAEPAGVEWLGAVEPRALAGAGGRRAACSSTPRGSRTGAWRRWRRWRRARRWCTRADAGRATRRCRWRASWRPGWWRPSAPRQALAAGAAGPAWRWTGPSARSTPGARASCWSPTRTRRCAGAWRTRCCRACSASSRS